MNEARAAHPAVPQETTSAGGLAWTPLAFIVAFLYLYSINLTAIPLGLGSRVYLGLAGMGILFINVTLKSGRRRVLEPQFWAILGTVLLLAWVGLVAVFLNQSNDFELVKYCLSVLIIIAAAYCLVTLFDTLYGRAAPRLMIYVFVACVAVQCMLAVVMFLNPPIKEALIGMLNAADADTDLISSAGEIRLIGFGSTFFGAGITNGMALLLIVYSYRHLAPGRGARLALGAAYVLTALAGTLMSRTTVLGFALSLLYLFMACMVPDSPAGRRGPYMRHFLLSVMGTLALLAALVWMLIDTELIMPVLDWAFEPVINYFSGTGLKSDSTDQLFDMYGAADLSTLPLAFGDARFTDPLDPSLYYQHVDIGYLRLIYYFGLPGTAVYLLLQLRAVVASSAFFKADKPFIGILGFYLLLLNFKGFADIFPFTILFFLHAYLHGNSGGTAADTPRNGSLSPP